MISFKQKGGFKKTFRYLKKAGDGDYLTGLRKFGEEGVRALSEATPVDSGKTSLSWSYSINMDKEGLRLSWNNSNVNKGLNVAILIQYGHGMPNGYYVSGVDYINPALKPIFDKIGKHVWEEVTRDA